MNYRFYEIRTEYQYLGRMKSDFENVLKLSYLRIDLTFNKYLVNSKISLLKLNSFLYGKPNNNVFL
jgi:hypothetical protein